MAEKDEPITLLMKQGASERAKYEGRMKDLSDMMVGDIFRPASPFGLELANEKRVLPKKDLDLLKHWDKVTENDNYSKVFTREEYNSLSPETVEYFKKEKAYRDKDRRDPNFFSNFINNLATGTGERIKEGSDLITHALTRPDSGDPVMDFGGIDPPLDLQKRGGEAIIGGLTMAESPLGGLSKAMVPDRFGEGGRLAFELAAPLGMFGVGKWQRAYRKTYKDLGDIAPEEFEVINNIQDTGKLDEHHIVEIMEHHRMKTAKEATGEVEEVAEVKKLTDEELKYGALTTAHIVRYTKAAIDIIGHMGTKTPFREVMGLEGSIAAKEIVTPVGKEARRTQLPKNLNVGQRLVKALNESAAMRNAFLVSSFSTAMRNAETVLGFFGIHAADEALQGVIRSALKRGAVDEKELGASLSYINDLLKAKSPFTPGENNIDKIFRAYSDEIVESGLFKQTVFESKAITSKVQGIAHMASALNNFQEYYFRRIAFEAMMRQLSRRRGVDFDLMRLTDVPLDDIKTAAAHALRMTFAKNPDGALTKVMLKELSSGPWSGFLKLSVMPFPRFVFGNAVPFMYEFSPLGMLSALSPRVMRKLAGGDPAEFAKYASRAMIGSSMLHIAMNLRGGSTAEYKNLDGTITRLKWYEAMVGDKVTDLRPFAPLIGPYMYASEAILHPENLGMSDVAELFFGLNRLGATGLAVVDSFIAARSEESGDMEELIVGKAVGNLLGSMMIPKLAEGLLHVSVGLGILSPERTAWRSDATTYIAQDPVENIANQMFKTLQRNIPIWREMMPRAYDPIDPTRGLPKVLQDKLGLGFTNDFYKELTGVKLDKPHPITMLKRRYGFTDRFGGSRTGVKYLDNMVNAEIAIEINKKGGLADQVKGPEFKKLGYTGRAEYIRNYFANPTEGIIFRSGMKTLVKVNKKGFQEGDLLSRQIMMQYISRLVFKNEKDLRGEVLERQGRPADTRPENVLDWRKLAQDWRGPAKGFSEQEMETGDITSIDILGKGGK